jgi:hypothetical protein
MINFLKFLTPSSSSGRLLLTTSIIFSVATYLTKFLIRDTIWSNATGMLCLPVIPIVGTTLIIYLIITIYYCFKPHGHIAPLVVFVFGLIIAIYLPVGSGYEERLFNAHRPDFEQVVLLARSGKMSHSQDCDNEWTFELPIENKNVLGECIYVDYQPFFSVQFLPRSYIEKIVYIEDQTRIKEVMSCDSDNEGSFQQMDKNWFLCTESP